MKVETLYIEKELTDHPRVNRILNRYPHATRIFIERYGEIFNRHNQNFRIQKHHPALILAKKHGKLIHPIPELYSIGRAHNFYFSHLLNCPFDCQYCFLQGLYRSAHFVFFINFEDFQNEIIEACTEKTTFFSGYDGDSLALENLTGFLHHFMPFFANQSKAELEIRTKSINIRPLLSLPSRNSVIAYSLSPHSIARRFEHKTPPLKNRLQALKQLIESGFQVGLRFDPLIWIENFEAIYAPFFEEVFQTVSHPHSVTLGTFRAPQPIFQRMVRLMPHDPILATCSQQKDQLCSPHQDVEQQMLLFAKETILRYIPKERFFPCQKILSLQEQVQG